LIADQPDQTTASSYRLRFGSLMETYEAVGYTASLGARGPQPRASSRLARPPPPVRASTRRRERLVPPRAKGRFEEGTRPDLHLRLGSANDELGAAHQGRPIWLYGFSL